MTRDDAVLDLLVVGAGPTGIAIGAAARKAGLEVLLVDRGPLVASLVDYPNDMLFFTTRDKLEIADIPFAAPNEKPSRQQAIAYYQAVARRYELPTALYEEVTRIVPDDVGFRVESRSRDGERRRRCRNVAVATGYFTWPDRLGVPGEERPWVRSRYREPWPHFGQRVVLVGGGNSAAEVALELWRHGADVTMVVRDEALKPTVKYWVKPDVENRIAEGSIRALFGATVERFDEREVVVRADGGTERLPADACYVLIGYRPDASLYADAGVRVDPETLVPAFDEATCETDVPGLFVAGTIQAGSETHRIFIENSRDNGDKIVRRVLESGRHAGAGEEAGASASR